MKPCCRIKCLQVFIRQPVDVAVATETSGSLGRIKLLRTNMQQQNCGSLQLSMLTFINMIISNRAIARNKHKSPSVYLADRHFQTNPCWRCTTSRKHCYQLTNDASFSGKMFDKCYNFFILFCFTM